MALSVSGQTGPAAPGGNTTNGTNGTNETSGANGTGPNGTVVTVTNGTGTANTTNATNAPGASGSGGFGFGIPSASDVANDTANATFNAIADTFADGLGSFFLLPWTFITLRFAPFDAAGDVIANGPDGLWSRPNVPVFGQLWDLAMGSMFEIAVLLFVLMFLIDWLGNLSPNSPLGAVDRLFLRAADAIHLLFSWPIAFGHFIIASAIAWAFMPSREAVASTLTEGVGGIVGVFGAGVAVVVLPFLLVIVAWLLLKHAGAFVYLLIGLAAYPALVAASIPDHPILGKLGAYAENARASYPKAAWYPVPTAIVLGIGYAIDQAVIDLMAVSVGPITNDAAGPMIFYPLLWLAALYAPEKVFNDATVTDRAKRLGTAALAGGATGAAAGSAAGASSGAAAGSASGATTASAVGAGSTAAGALPEGRFSNGSGGASFLARDGGTATVSGGESGKVTDFTGSQSGTADAVAPKRADLDVTQRYEPVVQHEKGGFDRVERPRKAEWLTDDGGVSRLDEATDRPLYFKGESDGQMYDLRRASSDSPAFAGSESGESVRNT